jgi:hypothetical protein
MVKTLLEEGVGWDSSWKICPTTDGVSNVVSSRSITRHGLVGLTVVYENNCVDYTLHLVIEDAINTVAISSLQVTIPRVWASWSTLNRTTSPCSLS